MGLKETSCFSKLGKNENALQRISEKKKREKEFILVMFVSLETISKIIITNLADPVYFK